MTKLPERRGEVMAYKGDNRTQLLRPPGSVSGWGCRVTLFRPYI
jgi:hypothetical protein